jgi:hypothetical protein
MKILEMNYGLIISEIQCQTAKMNDWRMWKEGKKVVHKTQNCTMKGNTGMTANHK